MQNLKSLGDIVNHFVILKGLCRIADLGSAYNGTFGSFTHASEKVQIDAVDVIFSGEFIPGESPTPNPTKEVNTSPFINLIGCRIEDFLKKEGASYDIILFSDVYSARLDLVAIRSLLGKNGVFIAGRFNGHVFFGTSDVNQQRYILRDAYPGFSMFWQLRNRAFAMIQAGALTSDYPHGFLDFYFGDDIIPM